MAEYSSRVWQQAATVNGGTVELGVLLLLRRRRPATPNIYCCQPYAMGHPPPHTITWQFKLLLFCVATQSWCKFYLFCGANQLVQVWYYVQVLCGQF